jgi:protein SCO1
MTRIGTWRRWRLLVAAGALLFSPAAWAAAEQKYPAFGLVLKIDGPHRFEVSCKEIPGLMDAMVMTLEVRNRGELKAIRPGALVDFTLVVDSDSSYAEKIHVHEFESSEQRPLEVQMLTMIEEPFDAKAGGGPMLKVDQKVPDFTLMDQNRHAVKFSDLSGKVVALSFVYTKCSYSQYCFRLSNNLGLVGKRFADRMGKDLVLLTVTFDPDTDSPETLAQYARTWKASAKGWYFLTGPPEDVKPVCLMFGMNFWPEMGMLVHTMHTAVIDRQGRMVANLEGNEFSAEQLGNLIETVMDSKH